MSAKTMLHSRAAKDAIQALPRARQFSSSAAKSAILPYRRSQPPATSAQTQRPISDSAKRPAQAAAVTSPQRAVPSPAFNRSEDARLRDVQPLQPFRQPEMDHSFVGMTGGEIFHEMMLRQGVKHVCTLTYKELLHSKNLTSANLFFFLYL
jgi:acetolactate synthase I/II/III large subunit